VFTKTPNWWVIGALADIRDYERVNDMTWLLDEVIWFLRAGIGRFIYQMGCWMGWIIQYMVQETDGLVAWKT